MKWIDRLKAKIIHALGGMTRTEVMLPVPTVQVLNYDVQTIRMVEIIPAFSRTYENEIVETFRAEVAHEIAKYVMEHDTVVYNRDEESNNDLRISATFRFVQPNDEQWRT